jgi:son of sevenless-like protein
MKLIVQDTDLVDKEDLGILNRMTQFASGTDVYKIAAAKQLLAAIKRVVRCFFLSVPKFF